MNVRIRVEYIDSQGSKRQKTVDKEVPDFKEIVFDKILNHKLKYKSVISIDSQILDYLDENSFGKWFLENESNSYIIINYWVANKKETRDHKRELIVFVNKHIKDDKIKIDFYAVYKHMEHSLKGLKTDRKANIVLAALSSTYNSATNAYINISNLFNKEGKFLTDYQSFHPDENT